MNNRISIRACPVCDHLGVVEIIHRQRFVLQDSHFLPREYDVVACTQCGCVYADSPAGQAIYDRYYADMSRYESGYVESDTRLYVERVDWIERVIPERSAHLIDVGCGNGELLRELKGRGYSRLAGLDPSAQCARQLSALGIEGMQGSFFDYTESGPYDCAILSGVLEHICDVAGLMQAMCRLLRKNGLLLVCVPDAARYCTHDAIPFDYFNIEHINHFDEASLLNLGLHHGMTIHHLEKTHIEVGKIRQPVIFCAYSNDGYPPTDMRRYSADRLRAYVSQTAQRSAATKIIDALAATQEEIIVWGAGNFAARLLATTALPKCRILFWVDNDKHKQTTELLGRRVVSPDVLGSNPTATVLIAAAVYGDEIATQIRSLTPNARIVCLAAEEDRK